jgi:putative protease
MKLFNFLKKIKGAKKSAVKKPAKKVKKKSRGKLKKKIRKPAVKKIKNKLQKNLPKSSRRVLAVAKEKEIGVVTHYFNKISVGIIKLKTPLGIGDKIHIKGAHDDFTQTVESMQINHQSVSRAPKGAEIGIKVAQRVHENDKVYFSAKK